MDLRKKFVLEAVTTDNFRQLCREYGISAKTGYKWKERFLAYGFEGMSELSRRPLRSPNQLKEDAVCEIVRLKQAHKYWGPKKIRQVYARAHGQAPSVSTFKRVLEKAGMTQERLLRKRRDAGRIFTGYKAAAPNEVWSVDFKGHWYCADGTRTEPLTVMDEFSRYLLELWKMEGGTTELVRARFERLFSIYGLPERIRSDNGSPFASREGVLGLTRFSAWLLVLGIGLERSRVGCPQDNCWHERGHLDVANELEREKKGDQASFDIWRTERNDERAHEALGMKCPAEVYKKSPRRYEGTPEDIEYPGLEARKVQKAGHCWYEGRSFFISSALAGWSVGLEPFGINECRVWFGKLMVGVLKMDVEKFEAATSLGQEVGK